MMGLSLYRDNYDVARNPPPMRKQFSLKDMLPSPTIMKALTTFVPRAMALNNSNSLDESLVPKDSSIRHLFEEGKTTPETRITHHRINTPVGNVQISTMTQKF